MGIKGKTEIELKDIHTGKTETIVEENMITNVIADLFSHNIEGMLFNIGGNTADLNENLLPLCKNAIGGILLFSEPLAEEADKYYAPSANPCTGYASNDVNGTANEMRGSLNLNESRELDNGYKFVWDFTTSQANGTIAAVALTHKNGGIGYFGDELDNESKIWCMKSLLSDSDNETCATYLFTVEVNFDENYLYTIEFNMENKIVIRKVRTNYRSIGFMDGLMEKKAPRIIDEHIISPTVFTKGSPDNTRGYYDFYDGRNGYWYGFMHSSSGSSDSSVKWIKINKTDFTFTEGTWTLKNVSLGDIGYHDKSFSSSSRRVNSVIRDGYLYVPSYDRSSVYKINVDKSADVTKIELGFNSNFSASPIYQDSGSTTMVLIGDCIVCSDFMLDSKDRVHHTYNAMPFSHTGTPLFQYGPYLISYGEYSPYRVCKNLFLLTPYLASINNLEAAVIKTADKTMKITYTVTETE